MVRAKPLFSLLSSLFSLLSALQTISSSLRMVEAAAQAAKRRVSTRPVTLTDFGEGTGEGIGIEMTNPMVKLAEGSAGKADEAPTDLDLGDHIDINVVEEGGAAEDESDDEAEGSGNRVSIGGANWSVNKPSRRSTITVFEQAGVGELGDGSSQGGTVSPARLPGGGPRTLAKKRLSMSAVEL